MKKRILVISIVIAVIAIIVGIAMACIPGIPGEENHSEDTTAHIHQFGEWTTAQESTCTVEGKSERKCSCGFAETQPIPMTEHTLTDWEHSILATCKNVGVDKRGCKNCDYVESRDVEILPHYFNSAFATTIDGKTVFLSVCKNCGDEVEVPSSYDLEQPQYESRLFDCPSDFNFDIVCAEDESYIRENLIISYAQFDEEIFDEITEYVFHPYQVKATDKENVWRVFSDEPYLENTYYVAKLNGDIAFLDYYGEELYFNIEGPNKQNIEFSDDILFLKDLEAVDPGYYPYDLSYFEADSLYRLVLSQKGIFDDTLIGKILCVGDCSNTSELLSTAKDVTFGKIKDVYEDDGRTVLVMCPPPISEVYKTLDISGPGLITSFEEPIKDEIKLAFAENMLAQDGFAEMLNAVNLASLSYAKDYGYEVELLKYSNIKELLDELDIKFPEDKRGFEDNKAYFTVLVTFNPEIPVTVGKKELGKIKIETSFTIRIDIAIDINTNISDWLSDLDDYIAEKVKNFFFKDQSIVGKDHLLTFDAEITNTTDIQFDLSIRLDMAYSHDSENYFIVHPNSKTLHRYDCRIVSKYADNFSCRYTYSKIKEDSSLYKSECSICKPLTRSDVGFVLVNSKTVHRLDCFHLKKVTSPNVSYHDLYPLGYTACKDCIPEPSEVSASFDDYLKKSTESTDWGESLCAMKDMLSDILNKDREEVEHRDYSNPVVKFNLLYIFEVLVDLDFNFDFKMYASAKLDIDYKRVDKFAINLVHDNNGYDFDAGKVEYENKDGPKVTLEIRGKAELMAGPNTGIKIGLVGFSNVFYCAIEAEVGIYTDLSGIMHFENATSDRPRPENYFAAYLEAGYYWDLRVVYKLIVIDGEFDNDGKFDKSNTKTPIYKGGDRYAYFSYTDYDQELYVGENSFKLPEEYLEVNRFDLKSMDKTDPVYLDPAGKKGQYVVSYRFLDESGKDVSYCSVDKNGTIHISDQAPREFTVKMVVTVTDMTIPDDLLEYLATKVTTGSNAYFLDPLEIKLHYVNSSPDMSITSITAAPLKVLEGEEITVKVQAVEAVKYGVAFYYHEYTDCLATFKGPLQESYTLQIPEAGVHKVTVYPLDENGNVLAGKGFGKSVTVQVFSKSICAAPEFITEKGQEIELGNALTVSWNPIFYPTDQVVYSVYLQNDTSGAYTEVVSGITSTSATIPAELLQDAGNYSVQVYASYTGTDAEIAQSQAATLTFSVIKGACKHEEIKDAVLLAPTCTEEGITRKRCLACNETWVENTAPTDHQKETVPDKQPTCIEAGWKNWVRCSVCLHVFSHESLNRLDHNFEDGQCTVCGTPEPSYGKHPAPTYVTLPQTITVGEDFLVEWNAPENSHGLPVVYNLYTKLVGDTDYELRGEHLTGTSFLIRGEWIDRAGDYNIDLYAKASGYAWSQGVTLTITVVEKTHTEHIYENGICTECGDLQEIAVIESNDHKYVLYDISLTWHEAKVLAQNLGGHLVTITSADEQSIVEQLLEHGSKKQYWLGLDTSMDTWITGENISYTNWDPGQPDGLKRADGEFERYIQIYNERNPHPAATQSRRFKWNDIFYDNTRVGEEEFFELQYVGFICEWELSDEMPEVSDKPEMIVPNDAIEYNGHYYLVFYNDVDWQEANDYCRSLGGYLCTITTPDEQTLVESLATKADICCWLGGYFDGTNWVWVTNEDFNYTHWDVAEPSYVFENEVELYLGIYGNDSDSRFATTGMWNDFRLITPTTSGFICEWDFKGDTSIDSEPDISNVTLFDSSDMSNYSSTYVPQVAPFTLYDTNLFCGQVITSISFPYAALASGYTVDSLNLYFPIYVIKSDFSTMQDDCTIENGKKIILDFTGKLKGVKTGEWITVDNLHIEVGPDETLAFGDTSMAVLPLYLRNNGTYGFWNNVFGNRGENNNHSLILKIKGYSMENINLSKDGDRDISFLGDSISTYSDWSNNSKYNSTIGSNAVWYPKTNIQNADMPVESTWWYRTTIEGDYKLCVNNSWSGSTVSSSQTYNIRSQNLHNTATGAIPDVIVILIGVNDWAVGVEVGFFDGTTDAPEYPKTFSEAYGLMLTYIAEKYPNAEIFCCTFLPDRNRSSNGINSIGISEITYNDAICTIAKNMGVGLIDLYGESSITSQNISLYTVDNLHPNAEGMAKISEAVLKTIALEED